MDRELRRIVVVGLVLLVVLFAGRAVIASIYDAEEARRLVDAQRSKLQASGEAGRRPPRELLGRGSALREQLETELADAIGALQYGLPAEFAVPPGTSADLWYFEVLRREQDRLVKGAAFQGSSVPVNLGMPELNPTGLEETLEVLRSLHVVHVVVSAALAAGIEEVAEIEVPGKRRRSAEAGFLTAHPVRFAMRGSPHAVAATLRAVVSGDAYLALDEVDLQVEDDDAKTVRCEFAAAALSFDAELAGLRP